MKFTELGLNEQILDAIDHMGFVNATPIQQQAIPLILAGKDLIACAQTGTGKTAAFILPVLHKLAGKEDLSINTLIIVPTRELAVQIEQEIQGLSYFVSVGSIAIYGGGSGKDWDEQKAALTEGRDIIVATPGKLISHLTQEYIDLSKVQHLILDEADKMLDMGFSDDLLRIISFLPKERQNLMFSATMPPKIRDLAKHILKAPEEITLSISKPAAGVTQRVALTYDNQKIPLIKDILDKRPEYTSIIIFTSSKSRVNEIVHSLKKNGFKAYGFSSNLEQEQREEILRGFRSRRIRILVATDVMSRGIDIKEINLVINFDTPYDAEDYVHRVGRTARANTKGEAITLVNEKDMRKLAQIERLIEAEVPRMELPADLGPGPEWKVMSSGNKKKKRPFKRKPKIKGPTSSQQGKV
ncbi:MAG: DEAD/DEAH box helicase [Bacteroidota bacterium]|jgi:superfamily II DNA/RNA helicase